MLSTLLDDIRLACRWMRRQPTFTAVVIATLALGIGANTAVFALVDAALLRRLPYADADRLVMARRVASGKVASLNSTPDFYDYREQASSFDTLAAVHGIALRGSDRASPRGPEPIEDACGLTHWRP